MGGKDTKAIALALKRCPLPVVKGPPLSYAVFVVVAVAVAAAAAAAAAGGATAGAALQSECVTPDRARERAFRFQIRIDSSKFSPEIHHSERL